MSTSAHWILTERSVCLSNCQLTRFGSTVWYTVINVLMTTDCMHCNLNVKVKYFPYLTELFPGSRQSARHEPASYFSPGPSLPCQSVSINALWLSTKLHSLVTEARVWTTCTELLLDVKRPGVEPALERTDAIRPPIPAAVFLGAWLCWFLPLIHWWSCLKMSTCALSSFLWKRFICITHLAV